jgi:Tol biopolymer transport system component
VNGSAEPRRLDFAGEGVSAPALSRKGDRLAYSRRTGQADLWAWERGELGKSPLSSTRTDDTPNFSPDGSRVAFQSDRSGAMEVWVCKADATECVQMTAMKRNCGSPRWSPDGRSIAFDGLDETRQWDVYVIGAGGGQPRRLTRRPDNGTSPSWSGDGNWIYYRSQRSGRDEIYRMPAGGGTGVQLTRNGGLLGQESPDGKYLYFMKPLAGAGPGGAAGTTGLWRMPVEGGEETQVLETVYNRAFEVRTEGIYYMSWSSEDRASRLQFHALSGGKSRELAKFEGRIGEGLAVSPDGKRILFSRLDRSGADLMLVDNFR